MFEELINVFDTSETFIYRIASSDMEVVKVGKSVSSLLEELLLDLNREDLVYLERVPPPRAGERYRDLVVRNFLEFGIGIVLVKLGFADGRWKFYALVARNSWSGSAVVEGHLISNGKVLEYDPMSLPVSEVASGVEKFANAYWKAEERILGRKIEEAYREQ